MRQVKQYELFKNRMLSIIANKKLILAVVLVAITSSSFSQKTCSETDYSYFISAARPNWQIVALYEFDNPCIAPNANSNCYYNHSAGEIKSLGYNSGIAVWLKCASIDTSYIFAVLEMDNPSWTYFTVRGSVDTADIYHEFRKRDFIALNTIEYFNNLTNAWTTLKDYDTISSIEFIPKMNRTSDLDGYEDLIDLRVRSKVIKSKKPKNKSAEQKTNNTDNKFGIEFDTQKVSKTSSSLKSSLNSDVKYLGEAIEINITTDDNSNQNGVYQIVDLTGKIVFSGNYTQNRLRVDRDNLSSKGMFILMIAPNGHSEYLVEKIVIK